MQFGVFYEHQLPRPWGEESEHRLLKEALEQVELADRLGIEYAWEVEHHFLEEYSHSSAPEVFLAACSQRTERIRLGHGIVLMPSGFNHPARVAERLATLDLISDGRVEWGTGSASSRSELEGFGIDPEGKAPDVGGSGARSGQNDGDGTVRRLFRAEFCHARAQCGAQAAAETASSAVAGLLEPRDDQDRCPLRHGRAHLRLHRSRRRRPLGGRILRNV